MNLEISMEEILENSIKNYHVKGFDYICIGRTPESTLKLYFFDGDVRKLSEVVNPHDHRYSFQTHVLAGKVTNKLYKEDKYGQVYSRFCWDTPLNGGKGFTYDTRLSLGKIDENTYSAGESYFMEYNKLHTIQIAGNETILLLEQREDKVPLHIPTSTYVLGVDKEPPSITGMYDKFTADEIVKRLNFLAQKTDLHVRTV